MKISNTLPQFERFPALFITSGEYEAHFYIAFKGNLELQEILKMPPRENAKEKQAFVGKKSGMQSLSAVSHKERYLMDLDVKFAHKIHDIIHAILATYKLEEIYIFAPKFVTVRIIAGLDKAERKKIRMQFYKEYTKNNPIDLIKIFQAEIDKIQNTVMRKASKKNSEATLLK